MYGPLTTYPNSKKKYGQIRGEPIVGELHLLYYVAFLDSSGNLRKSF